jgi:hypothetical protein
METIKRKDEEEKIKWYNPMRKQIEKEIEEEIKNGGLSEETLRECWFIEQIKTILQGGDSETFENWKREKVK